MEDDKYLLIANVHEGLKPPTGKGNTYTVNGYKYYHYECDGISDQGWGCGYRTLQTLCSWVKYTVTSKNLPNVPSIHEIQQILVDVGDKPPSFVGSRNWIGSFEVFAVLNTLFGVDCKIIHVPHGELEKYIGQLVSHFSNFHSPAMMGGDQDCSSKGIVGIHTDEEKTYLLVIDPHFRGKARSAKELQSNGWVFWQEVKDFMDSSFYNICLPQL